MPLEMDTMDGRRTALAVALAGVALLTMTAPSVNGWQGNLKSSDALVTSSGASEGDFEVMHGTEKTSCGHFYPTGDTCFARGTAWGGFNVVTVKRGDILCSSCAVENVGQTDTGSWRLKVSYDALGEENHREFGTNGFFVCGQSFSMNGAISLVQAGNWEVAVTAIDHNHC